MSASPETLRAEAAQHERDAYESFERCDTDGFLSQWASGLSASQKRLQAEITEQGDSYEFPALFDLDGEIVPAKLLPTRYGIAWAIFASWDALNAHRSPIERWVTAFPVRESTMTRKGYYEGSVRAPARAELRGGNACTVNAVAVRTSYWLADIAVIDNGK